MVDCEWCDGGAWAADSTACTYCAGLGQIPKALAVVLWSRGAEIDRAHARARLLEGRLAIVRAALDLTFPEPERVNALAWDPTAQSLQQWIVEQARRGERADGGA